MVAIGLATHVGVLGQLMGQFDIGQPEHNSFS
jgi:hypothetical protein